MQINGRHNPIVNTQGIRKGEETRERRIKAELDMPALICLSRSNCLFRSAASQRASILGGSSLSSFNDIFSFTSMIFAFPCFFYSSFGMMVCGCFKLSVAR